MTRASTILETINRKHEKANNDFSTRIKLKNVKDMKKSDVLRKKIMGLVIDIIPDIEVDDITAVLDGDKGYIRVNIADVPTSLHDQVDKEVQKAVK